MGELGRVDGDVDVDDDIAASGKPYEAYRCPATKPTTTARLRPSTAAAAPARSSSGPVVGGKVAQQLAGCLWLFEHRRMPHSRQQLNAGARHDLEGVG